MLGTGLGVHVEHVAACPEDNPVLCQEIAVQPYRHVQDIWWFRADAGLWMGLGEGWQVGGTVPFDVRLLRIEYETLAGEPYDLPWANIHHRDEALVGPSDGRVLVQRFFRMEQGTVGGGVGVTVPLGDTEQDPYALTEEGLEHQHFQMGSGTVDPVASAWLTKPFGPRWGVLGLGDARIPVTTNGYGYRGPRSATLGLGPTYTASPKLQVQATAELGSESQELWHDVGYGGRTGVAASLGATQGVGKGWVLQGQARTTLWQMATHTEGDEQLRQRFVLTVGASWTPQTREEP
jgi:hypothetical protein